MSLSLTYFLQKTVNEPSTYNSKFEEETWSAFKRVSSGEYSIGHTARQLADAKLADGYSALHEAATQGSLRDFDGVTPGIMLESKYGQSRNTKFYDESALALAIKARHLNQVWEGVSSKLLASAPTRDGASLLYLAAQYGCIDQIYGGVTAQELE